MIISDKYKVIFIRVPKTGSTSFETLFKQIDPNCISSNNEKIPYGHHSASQLKKMIGEEKWNTYFKIAFIRNPINWFMSQYKDIIKSDFTWEKQLHIVLNEQYRINNPKDKIIKLEDCISLHIILSKWLDTTENNDIGQLAYLDLDIDYIALFENFNKEIEFIFSKLGITNFKIPFLNKSTSGNYTFSFKSKEFLKLTYEKDINFYNSIKNK